LLNVSVPELCAIAMLTLVHGFVDSLDDLEAVIRTQRWIVNSRWTIAALVELLRPGTPAIAVSTAAVANTAAGVAVTCTAIEYGLAQPPETVTFAANGSLATTITDWNAKAHLTIAYRADALGLPNHAGNRLAIRTRTGGASSQIEITADATGLFTAAVPRIDAGADCVLVSPALARPAAIDLANELVSEVAKGGSLVFSDTVFTRVPGVSDAQSRAIVRGNRARFEVVDDEGRYRLRADYDPMQPLALAGFAAAVEPSLRSVLAACHGNAVLLGALPGKLSISPEVLDRLVAMLGDDLSARATFAELRDPAVPSVRIAAIIDRIRRLAALFADATVFDPTTLDLIRVARALRDRRFRSDRACRGKVRRGVPHPERVLARTRRPAP